MLYEKLQNCTHKKDYLHKNSFLALRLLKNLETWNLTIKAKKSGIFNSFNMLRGKVSI